MKIEFEFVRELLDFTGKANLYKLNKLVFSDETRSNYIIVSATYAFGIPETYIFFANEEGQVIDWGELPGSYIGDLNMEKALEDFKEYFDEN